MPTVAKVIESSRGGSPRGPDRLPERLERLVQDQPRAAVGHGRALQDDPGDGREDEHGGEAEPEPGRRPAAREPAHLTRGGDSPESTAPPTRKRGRPPPPPPKSGARRVIAMRARASGRRSGWSKSHCASRRAYSRRSELEIVARVRAHDHVRHLLDADDCASGRSGPSQRGSFGARQPWRSNTSSALMSRWCASSKRSAWARICRSASSFVASRSRAEAGVSPARTRSASASEPPGSSRKRLSCAARSSSSRPGARPARAHGRGLRAVSSSACRPGAIAAGAPSVGPYLTHDQPGTMGGGGSQSGYAVGHRDTRRCRDGRVARAHPLGRARVGRSAAARGARALARHEHLAGARGGAQARGARARRARRPPRLARQGARRRRPARHLRGAPRARAGGGRARRRRASRRPRSSARRRRSRATRSAASAATGRRRATRTTRSTSRSTTPRAPTGSCA